MVCIPQPNRGITMHTRLRTLLLLPGLAGLALAQEVPQEPAPPDTPKVDFADVDKNRDGNVSRDEALATADLLASFNLLDVDRNRVLSPTEFARWNRAGNTLPKIPDDPATAPGGSAGAQHLPERQ